MEWTVIQVLITLVAFIGGFISGSWKLSGILATIQERLKQIDKNLEALCSLAHQVEDLSFRVTYLEKENKRLVLLVNKLIRKVDIEDEFPE